jgi:hypothetical protein
VLVLVLVFDVLERMLREVMVAYFKVECAAEKWAFIKTIINSNIVLT